MCSKLSKQVEEKAQGLEYVYLVLGHRVQKGTFLTWYSTESAQFPLPGRDGSATTLLDI